MKMMHIKSWLLAGIVVMMSTSCKKYLDINTDPNNPATAPKELVLPAAQASIAVTIGGNLFNLGSYWSQYMTQSPDAGQHEDIDSWNVKTTFGDRVWQEFYSGGLNDFEFVKEKALESGDNKYFLVATVMQAYGFQLLADLFDKIPYSQALLGSKDAVYQPTFDDGATVYAALLDKIDDALAKYKDDPSGTMGSEDLIYKGDMTQWVGFANTLKLKMYLRMAYTSSANPAKVLALLAEDNFITKDATMTQWADQQNRRNPWYEVEIDYLSGQNHIASLSLLQYLDDNVDTRIANIYTKASGAYVGNEQGDYTDRSLPFAGYSHPKITATTPVYLMTVAEAKFLVAEAAIRYNGGAGAKNAYEEGIDANFVSRGMALQSELYESGGPYEFNLTGTVEDDIRQVMEQKWVAMAMMQNIEAFFELNRTKYPTYSNSPSSGDLYYSAQSVLPAGVTPKRLFFPLVEVTKNTNAPAQPNNIGVNVWWDKK